MMRFVLLAKIKLSSTTEVNPGNEGKGFGKKW